MFHKKNVTIKLPVFVLLGGLFISILPLNALAAAKTMPDGTVFDAEYYATNNPDVVAALGTDETALWTHYVNYGQNEGRKPCADMAAVAPESSTGDLFDPIFYIKNYPDIFYAIGYNPDALYNHYLSNGQSEGRLPYEGAQPGASVNGIKTVTGIVPLNQLANLKSLKKSCTDEEFQEVYSLLIMDVSEMTDLSFEDKLYSCAGLVRYLVDNGYVVYTTSTPHYNDPYGYFVIGVGSCAGATRATGLLLNMLGISYEHVNENQWSHQWCRVLAPDGTYWVVDAYGLYVGPEPSAYGHPYF